MRQSLLGNWVRRAIGHGRDTIINFFGKFCYKVWKDVRIQERRSRVKVRVSLAQSTEKNWLMNLIMKSIGFVSFIKECDVYINDTWMCIKVYQKTSDCPKWVELKEKIFYRRNLFLSKKKINKSEKWLAWPVYTFLPAVIYVKYDFFLFLVQPYSIEQVLVNNSLNDCS